MHVLQGLPLQGPMLATVPTAAAMAERHAAQRAAHSRSGSLSDSGRDGPRAAARATPPLPKAPSLANLVSAGSHAPAALSSSLPVTPVARRNENGAPATQPQRPLAEAASMFAAASVPTQAGSTGRVPPVGSVRSHSSGQLGRPPAFARPVALVPPPAGSSPVRGPPPPPPAQQHQHHHQLQTVQQQQQQRRRQQQQEALLSSQQQQQSQTKPQLPPSTQAAAEQLFQQQRRREQPLPASQDHKPADSEAATPPASPGQFPCSTRASRPCQQLRCFAHAA